MATKARKERRRAGEKFVRTPKVATPLEERSSFASLVPGLAKTIWADKYVPRSQKKKDRMLKDRGIVPTPGAPIEYIAELPKKKK